ncbi:hypothetical protein [Neolewinella litorea]|uniref:Uncharacterized protein n=1 Tax=Neolewinella litorea TaxID=2562452 RepID=A0A4S4NYS4_9BACT|nr:hypothetical protein [Neolewinella litorea]THH41420.1 hypothetical protein E4021_02130 [Neolewinella litorea]
MFCFENPNDTTIKHPYYHNLLRTLRGNLPALLVGIAICSILLLAAILAHSSLPTTYGLLFRDMGSEVDLPVSHGLFSQLGIMLWSLGLGSLLLMLLSYPSPSHRVRAYILYSLVVTLTLAIDDAFRMHETFFDEVLGLGESVAFLIYFCLLLGYFVLFLHQILASPFPLLLIALGLFACSMLVDQTPGLANYVGLDETFLLEDGAKLAGIVFWTLYQLLMCRSWFQEALAIDSRKGQQFRQTVYSRGADAGADIGRHAERRGSRAEV